MRARSELPRAFALWACAALLGTSGCYRAEVVPPGPVDSGSGARDGGGASRDGATGRDGAAECLTWGEDRVCGDYCEHPCPSDHACNELFRICQPYSDPDPRGFESCTVDLGSGSRFCYSGAPCAMRESRFNPDRNEWPPGGACVDPGYCRWVHDGSGPAGVRCRHSEGQPFVDGPPDVPCGTGAFLESGFCGGRCGDTCRRQYTGQAPRSCVGISEERGFGACTEMSVRCTRANAIPMLAECSRRWSERGRDCSCMLLEQTLFPEYAENGWPLVTQTCLAYRDAFPGQVRCMDADWNER